MTHDRRSRMGCRRQGLRLVIIAACAMAGAACGGAKPGGEARPISASRTLHRVVLTRSWTPAVPTRVARRVDPNGAASVATQHVSRADGKKGWWLVLRDRTRSERVALGDSWTADIVARLYQDRRVQSAPKLSGIALTTRAKDFFGTTYEETAWWPRPVQRYAQGRPAALRAQITEAATRLGLVLRSFRAPRLNGILTPVVTLAEDDSALFKRWFNPGCLPGWIFNPRVSDGPLPYFGYFLSVEDSSGHWLMSEAVTPDSAEGEQSPRGARVSPVRSAQPGLTGCPNPPWR
jgi:hypothetical protein